MKTALALALVGSLSPRLQDGGGSTSGAPIEADQSCYDVRHYTLRLRVDPEEKRIDGSLAMSARMVAASPVVALDLDPTLEVASVTATLSGEPLAVESERAGGRIRIRAAEPLPEGAEIAVEVAYGGKPRVAENPPWDGGFTWARTKKGEPWIATSCQGEGADLWWPCKDQPSDEPESMDLFITVPRDLVVASNGRLVGVERSERGWRTHHWHVSTPINNYGVALNIAPYETISKDYASVAGDTFTVTYWVLPENVKEGKELFEDVLRQIAFFEDVFGPYPFRADKYGVAETPHLGMEHQTIIAYGNEYRGNPWGKQQGFDFLHHHEMAHEWWANLVTARNWNDFWIHEGFATYAQALYVERLNGPEEYRVEMLGNRRRIRNRGAVAPRGPRSTQEMSFSQEGASAPGNDVYYKGSWILHTLRFLVGDEKFFVALRRMAYPDPELEKVTDGSQCRFSDSEEIRAIAEEHTGQDLGWFFEVYLRQPELPRLVHEVQGKDLHLSWQTSNDLPFPMPIEVRMGKEVVRVEMPDGKATLPLKTKDHEIDPHHWVLRAAE